MWKRPVSYPALMIADETVVCSELSNRSRVTLLFERQEPATDQTEAERGAGECKCALQQLTPSLPRLSRQGREGTVPAKLLPVGPGPQLVMGIRPFPRLMAPHQWTMRACPDLMHHPCRANALVNPMNDLPTFPSFWLPTTFPSFLFFQAQQQTTS